MPDTARPIEETEGLESLPVSASPGILAGSLALVLGECLLLALAATDVLSVAAAFALHVLVGGSAALVAAARHREGRDVRLHLLLAVTTLGCGPFGALGTLGLAVVARWGQRASRPFQEWYESLFPEHEESISERVYDRVKSQLDDEDGEPASFADLVRFGSLEEKQAVIAIVGKHFKPAFAPILELALQDPVNAVRVQAATAISIVESRFSEAIVELTARLEAHPERSSDLLALARLYDDYAFTGLLDAERESNNREKALQCYQRYLLAEPDDASTKLAVGRLLLRAERYEEAAFWLKGVMHRDDPSPQLAIWYMECLFHLRRFAELRLWARRYAARIESSPESFPPAALGTLSLWSASDPEAAA